ncbi:MAG: DNA replication/repair protein RecF [Firmicutes bacterium]|nr:DNA replication/repair protein RecF [Bacillota bacterium]
MFLNKVELQNFRNYEKQTISFKSGINILVGKNGSGKTNILESIYYLAITHSHRTHDDSLLINNKNEFFKLKGIVSINSIKTNLEIDYINKKKLLKIDNNDINALNKYSSYLKIIIFFPDDLDLIKGLPDVRRKYISTEIGQVYPSYNKVLDDYNRILKNRNEYIKKIRNNEYYNKQYLEILNDYYIKKSILLYKMRKKYVEKINDYIENIFKDITGLDKLTLEYVPIIDFNSYKDTEMYDKIKNSINFNEEISYGKSIYGPHRDEFKFMLNDINLKQYGSQGQQRAAVLALKLSEINIFTKVIGSTPILLLDDVFSELDEDRKNNLLKYINGKIQTIITTTDIDNIDNKTLKKARVFEISSGKVLRRKDDRNG